MPHPGFRRGIENRTPIQPERRATSAALGDPGLAALDHRYLPETPGALKLRGTVILRILRTAGMNDDRQDDTGGRRRRRQRAGRRQALILATAMASFALLVAACGGSGSAGAGGSTPYQQALAYAQCMRSHGEPGFPDPNSQGLFLNLGPVDMNSSQYLSANKTCEHLLPASQVSTSQQRQAFSRQLKYAECMRSHGFPNIPDPIQEPSGNIQGAGPGGAAGPGSGIDPNSPQYKSANQVCLPFLAGAKS
jgi:hypothetical protein